MAGGNIGPYDVKEAHVRLYGQCISWPLLKLMSIGLIRNVGRGS